VAAILANLRESAWSNGKPAYRCRHGYTSAASPDPGRPKNLYVREDLILPRLVGLAILPASPGGRRKQAITPVTAPAQTAQLIDHLRATGASLTYAPGTRTVERYQGRDSRNSRPRTLTPRQHQQARKEAKSACRAPASAGGRAG
jgi:hypothetical protein